MNKFAIVLLGLTLVACLVIECRAGGDEDLVDEIGDHDEDVDESPDAMAFQGATSLSETAVDQAGYYDVHRDPNLRPVMDNISRRCAGLKDREACDQCCKRNKGSSGLLVKSGLQKTIRKLGVTGKTTAGSCICQMANPEATPY